MFSKALAIYLDDVTEAVSFRRFAVEYTFCACKQ